MKILTEKKYNFNKRSRLKVNRINKYRGMGLRRAGLGSQPYHLFTRKVNAEQKNKKKDTEKDTEEKRKKKGRKKGRKKKKEEKKEKERNSEFNYTVKKESIQRCRILLLFQVLSFYPSEVTILCFALLK